MKSSHTHSDNPSTIRKQFLRQKRKFPSKMAVVPNPAAEMDGNAKATHSSADGKKNEENNSEHPPYTTPEQSPRLPHMITPKRQIPLNP